MDARAEIRTFLTSRRAALTPEQAGLPDYGGTRRVAGLRRGEVAMLAGVSVEYYTRLERGNLGGVSGSVLEAVARALQLDETEQAHLDDLARVANATTTARARRRPAPLVIRPSVRHILAAMTTPAYVRNNRFDILEANPSGLALYSELYRGPERPVNTARFIFLDPRATRFFTDWDGIAHSAVGALRVQVGKNPHDRQLAELIGELSARSDDFRTWWAKHDVYVHGYGVKRLRHPVVGDLELAYDAMELPGDTGLSMVAYSAEPGSASSDALRLLASWSAAEQEAGARTGR